MDMLTAGLSDRLQHAVDLHRQGQAAAAVRLYRAILCEAPAQEDALQLLGLAAWRVFDDVAGAVELMTRALTVRPDSGPALQNIGPAMEEALKRAVARHNAGAAREAERLYRVVLRREPQRTEVLRLLARLHDTGDPADFEKRAEACRRLTVARPEERAHWIELGFALERAGRPDAACAAYATGVGAPPGGYAYCVAVANGLFTHRQGIDVARQQFPHARLERVIGLLRQALALNPHSSEARLTLARAYRIRHQVDQALEGVDAVLALNPSSFEGNLLRAHMLYRKGRLDEAATGYRAALEIAEEAKSSSAVVQRDLAHLQNIRAALAAHAPPRSPGPSAPIIFVHFGYNDYLMYALAAARVSNPDKEIILLGDDDNKFLSELGVSHFNLKDYRIGPRLAAFSTVGAFIYGAATIHDQNWSRFCFERWFILQAFTEAHGHERFWVFDSDTLLFASLAPTEPHLRDCVWTEQSNGSNIGGLIADRRALEDYLDFINAEYEPFARDLVKAADDGSSPTIVGGGALDDMALYRHYRALRPPAARRLSDVIADTTFSDLIWQSGPDDEWERDAAGVCILYFDKGYFYYMNRRLNRRILLNGANMSFVSFEKMAAYFTTMLERFRLGPGG